MVYTPVPVQTYTHTLFLDGSLDDSRYINKISFFLQSVCLGPTDEQQKKQATVPSGTLKQMATWPYTILKM